MRAIAPAKSWHTWAVAMAILLMCPIASPAAPTISLGTYNLQPNLANQTINIYVAGGDAVQGVDLDITTGDGGPAVGSVNSAPIITSVNFLAAGGIFASNNTGNGGTGQAQGGQFYQDTTATASGTVNLIGNFNSQGQTGSGAGFNYGLLAQVTISTAGTAANGTGSGSPYPLGTPSFFSGSYNISVNGTINNDHLVITEATDFPPQSSNQVMGNPGFSDGTINIVPEPASLALLGLALPALLLRRRARHAALPA